MARYELKAGNKTSLRDNKTSLRDNKGRYIKFLEDVYCVDCHKKLSNKHKPERCHPCANRFLIKRGIFGMKGKHQSDYQKQRVSQARKGKKASKETMNMKNKEEQDKSCQ
jgi:hypothetical protein